jgi:hypothetical protein
MQNECLSYKLWLMISPIIKNDSTDCLVNQWNHPKISEI